MNHGRGVGTTWTRSSPAARSRRPRARESAAHRRAAASTPAARGPRTWGSTSETCRLAFSAAIRSAKDTHVAACAAAILAGDFYSSTQVVSLVTRNIRDFGVRKLAALGIEVQQPDAFLLNQFRQDPAAVASAFAALRATLRSAPEPDRLLERQAADGQSLTAAALHDAWQQGAVRL